MLDLDPVTQGSKIFEALFKNHPDGEILSVDILDDFLKQLMDNTQGLFIVDFLDCGNWDCLGSYHVDRESQFVFLNWHHYDSHPSVEDYVRSVDYKPTITTLMIHFKDLKLERVGQSFPFMAMRGYALKNKEITAYFQKNGYKAIHQKDEEQNFYSLFIIDRGSHIEECYCYNTPIYSILMIPKNTAFTAKFSQKILFLFNYHDCLTRLVTIYNTFQKSEMSEDEICGNSNSIRRVFEFVLKIECCYHSQKSSLFLDYDPVKTFAFRNSYSDLTLGDLVNTLKRIKDSNDLNTLARIVRLANELSHDSGKKVTMDKAIELSKLAIEYTKKIEEQISLSAKQG